MHPTRDCLCGGVSRFRERGRSPPRFCYFVFNKPGDCISEKKAAPAQAGDNGGGGRKRKKCGRVGEAADGGAAGSQAAGDPVTVTDLAGGGDGGEHASVYDRLPAGFPPVPLVGRLDKLTEGLQVRAGGLLDQGPEFLQSVCNNTTAARCCCCGSC
jgi:hypothetical protein